MKDMSNQLPDGNALPVEVDTLKRLHAESAEGQKLKL